MIFCKYSFIPAENYVLRVILLRIKCQLFQVVHYLIDPDGKFDQYYGQTKKMREMVDDITMKMFLWEKEKEFEAEKK